MCNNPSFQLGRIVNLSRLRNNITRLMNSHFCDNTSAELNYTEPNLKYTEKIMTVAFWDIKNFSLLCETLKTHPKLIVLFLREFLELARRIICEQDGTIDTFLGDGVMALFGFHDQAKNSASNAAICAVISALQMRDAFSKLQSRWVKSWNEHVPNKISIGLKCGINTGYATFDNLGTAQRTQFTVVGNTVNLARRLTDISDSGQIIISRSTKSKVQDRFELTRIGVVTDLKNIQGSYEIFDVVKSIH